MGGLLEPLGRGTGWLKSFWGHGKANTPTPAPSDGPADAPRPAPIAVGIDLGTTMSAVSYITATGRTDMVRNAAGDFLTPSVVLFEPNDRDVNVVVGRDAKKAVGTRPDAVAECAKRDMGSKEYSRPILDKRVEPEVIQACILRQLKQDIDAQLGTNYTVVITVPAYFDEPQRRATKKAGRLAGLNVLDIVNEPTAAALAFGEHHGYLDAAAAPREEMMLLVYDLGGGTFDVTVVRLRPGDIFTLATDGEVLLGGRDWDGRLADWMAEQFLQEHGIDPRLTPANCASLYCIAEELKRALSVRSEAARPLEFDGQGLCVQITRAQFEAITEKLLERTLYRTRRVLAAAALDWKGINRILLVGGSTRMPVVADKLEEHSGITPDHGVHPDEAVARGAALYAQHLIAKPGGENSLRIVNVNAHDLGIEGTNLTTNRQEHAVLIPKNTPLPAERTRRFVTARADQRSVVIKVLEGDAIDPGRCTFIGRATLADLPRDLPKGHRIDVTFRYTRSSLLQVEARLPGTGRDVVVDFVRDRNGNSDGTLGRQEAPEPGKGGDLLQVILRQIFLDWRDAS
jgi:molecular chaperone DnaK